jgi:hypothetical protein
MRTDRYFYSAVGAIFVLVMITGFHAFYLHQTRRDGSSLDASIFTIVAIHGLAITAWFLLFLVQSLLISVKNRGLHMKLGWSALAIGLTIAFLSPIVAIQSVKVTPPQFHFYGMLYSRFLLSMFTEVATFTFFVAAGILTRKKPKIHRTMMVMAGISLISGAFSRIPALHIIFGNTGWMGLYGPAFCLGMMILVVHWAMTRSLDKWFAVSLAGWAIVLYGSIYLANSAMWDGIVAKIIG